MDNPFKGLTDKAKELAKVVRSQAEDALKVTEATFAETSAHLDKDNDGVPDALRSLQRKAKEAREHASARFAELQSHLDKDGDGVPDRLEHLGKAAKDAAHSAKEKAEELAAATRAHFANKK